MKKYFLLLITFSPIAAFAQPGTEIILFDINTMPVGIALSNPVNITKHKGYDNQPFFYKSHVYYSSQVDSGQIDIVRFDDRGKTTRRLTLTDESEFSPTITPDQKFISCILQRKNGKQDLVKYPVKGGDPKIVIDDLKVGYHTWATNNQLLLFVLEDSTTFGLHHYNADTKNDKRIASNIGRGLNKIPGKNAISFIQKDSTGWMIKEYNIQSGKVGVIMPALPGRDFLAWTKKGLIIMSDGKDIFFAKPGNKWQKIEIRSDLPLKNITRLAINEQNTKLAVVISE